MEEYEGKRKNDDYPKWYRSLNLVLTLIAAGLGVISGTALTIIVNPTYIFLREETTLTRQIVQSVITSETQYVSAASNLSCNVQGILSGIIADRATTRQQSALDAAQCDVPAALEPLAQALTDDAFDNRDAFAAALQAVIVIGLRHPDYVTQDVIDALYLQLVDGKAKTLRAIAAIALAVLTDPSSVDTEAFSTVMRDDEAMETRGSAVFACALLECDLNIVAPSTQDPDDFEGQARIIANMIQRNPALIASLIEQLEASLGADSPVWRSDLPAIHALCNAIVGIVDVSIDDCNVYP